MSPRRIQLWVGKSEARQREGLLVIAVEGIQEGEERSDELKVFS